jgi:hypothetical protein
MVHHHSHNNNSNHPNFGNSLREGIKASPRASLVVGPPTCFWMDRDSTTVFRLRTVAIMAREPLSLEQWGWYDSSHVQLER